MTPHDAEGPHSDHAARPREGGPAPRGWDRSGPPGEGRGLAVPPGLGGVRGIYERYCDHEARHLLGLVPRDGLRTLYRAARDAAGEEEGARGAPSGEPMALMVRFARRLLPLPPYEVWLRSYLRDRAPYLEALGIASVPDLSEPVLVDVRPLDGGWTAGLHLFHRPEGWRGFLRFQRESDSQGYRTADIFHGDDPRELRQRFQEFHSATLQAFLRSVLA